MFFYEFLNLFKGCLLSLYCYFSFILRNVGLVIEVKIVEISIIGIEIEIGWGIFIRNVVK